MIAQRREELGLTQKQLAEMLGVYDRTIQRWEEAGSPGRKTAAEMLQICNAYGWSLEQLAQATGIETAEGTA